MRSGSTRVQGLVFGGLMAALVTLFALVPFLTLFLPVPLVLTFVRYGGRAASLAAVVAMLFTVMFTGPVLAFWTLPWVVMGLVFGYGIRHRLKPFTIGLVAVVVFFLGQAGQYVVTRTILMGGQDPFVAAMETDMGRQMIDRYVEMMESYTVIPDDATEEQRRTAAITENWVAEFKADPVGVIWFVLPMALLISAVWISWLAYMLCGLILRRLGHDVPRATPFTDLHLPIWLAFTFVALVLLFAASITGSLLNAPWWAQVLFNVVPPLQILLVVVGMAVAYGFLRKKDVPKPFAVIIVATGFMMGPLGTQIYVILAILDSLLDFRRLGHGWAGRPQRTS